MTLIFTWFVCYLLSSKGAKFREIRASFAIESIQEQIELHKEKKSLAEDSGNEELAAYYTKEIEAKERAKKEKEAMLEKQ